MIDRTHELDGSPSYEFHPNGCTARRDFIIPEPADAELARLMGEPAPGFPWLVPIWPPVRNDSVRSAVHNPLAMTPCRRVSILYASPPEPDAVA